MTVILYTTRTCPYCKLTKSFFVNHNILYREIDVIQDKKALEKMIQVSGQMGVPVTVVAGQGAKEDVIVGFDQERLSSTLGIK